MTISEEIDQFIAENGGIERDAVNVALTRWKAAEREIESLKKQLKNLIDELVEAQVNPTFIM